MRKVLCIALLCIVMFGQVSAQDKKNFVSIESGTTLDLTDPQFSGNNNFDTKLCPGFYFRLYFNQVLSDKFTLREGVGYNIARTYEENFNDASNSLRPFDFTGVSANSVQTLNIPVHLLWTMNQRVQFFGGFSLDASLTDSNTYFEVRNPLYTKDDLKNLRNITYSVELGTKIKVMKNGYISLGYKYIPKPIEIANPNYIVETTKHQINIGLVYDFK